MHCIDIFNNLKIDILNGYSYIKNEQHCLGNSISIDKNRNDINITENGELILSMLGVYGSDINNITYSTNNYYFKNLYIDRIILYKPIERLNFDDCKINEFITYYDTSYDKLKLSFTNSTIRNISNKGGNILKVDIKASKPTLILNAYNISATYNENVQINGNMSNKIISNITSDISISDNVETIENIGKHDSIIEISSTTIRDIVICNDKCDHSNDIDNYNKLLLIEYISSGFVKLPYTPSHICKKYEWRKDAYLIIDNDHNDNIKKLIGENPYLKYISSKYVEKIVNTNKLLEERGKLSAKQIKSIKDANAVKISLGLLTVFTIIYEISKIFHEDGKSWKNLYTYVTTLLIVLFISLMLFYNKFIDILKVIKEDNIYKNSNCFTISICSMVGISVITLSIVLLNTIII